jgi:fido (protein-threonine AMPylation protein)
VIRTWIRPAACCVTCWAITDAAELSRAEAALSASRLIDLERRRLPGRHDLAHLQAFRWRVQII